MRHICSSFIVQDYGRTQIRMIGSSLRFLEIDYLFLLYGPIGAKPYQLCFAKGVSELEGWVRA